MNRRREIADRVLARWKARGIALEALPDYMDFVNLWIEGEIDGAEMHRRYLLGLQTQAPAGSDPKSQEPPVVSDMISVEAGPDMPTSTAAAPPPVV